MKYAKENVYFIVYLSLVGVIVLAYSLFGS